MIPTRAAAPVRPGVSGSPPITLVNEDGGSPLRPLPSMDWADASRSAVALPAPFPTTTLVSHPSEGNVAAGGTSTELTPLQKLYKDRTDLINYLQIYREEVSSRERYLKGMS